MHLAKRSGGGGFALERRKLGFPILTKLGAHAALHERPAHSRRVRLQFAELFRVSLGQEIRNC